MNEAFDNPLMTIALVAVLSFCASWLGVKYLIRYLVRHDIVDRPNDRSMHEGIVPRGGGLVIVGVIIMTLLSMLLTTSRPLFFVGLTVSVLAWATLSWCDDRFDLSPKSRFVTQGLISSITVALYGWVGVLLEMDLAWAGPVLSVIGIIWMANLNNFMDGMDGLASSQAIVGSVTFGVWFFYLGDHELAILCAAIASSSYGFLLWNWQPAKIFMGDVGSITLGGLFATLMIIAANRHNIPVLSLLMVFGVFIGDSTCTILNRMRKGERFWLPHRSHFYQRAGLSGVKHSKVVFTSVILMVLCSLIATLSILYRDIIVQLLILVAVLLTFISFLVMKLEKRANI